MSNEIITEFQTLGMISLGDVFKRAISLSVDIYHIISVKDEFIEKWLYPGLIAIMDKIIY